MKEVVKKEILYDLQQTLHILEKKDSQDFQQFKDLSNHAIEDVAAQKDLDLVAVTVLLYSLYKIVENLSEKEYTSLLKDVAAAKSALERNRYGQYNVGIRKLFYMISSRHVLVKEHLQDVLQAARIKKGTVLLQKGLSIGQAAGLMGLSNWDLQAYAARTTALEPHQEKVSVKTRLAYALGLFGVSRGK